ncbi:efflux RND transporter periplasmic adaptor subunit [Candidatus Entotheonella palauensis]|nr:HlyD family efflux transporter periplasmic adaptor subunit [Candidatus Entotheonella palauensis]
MIRRALVIVTVIAVLAVGVGGMRFLISQRKPPPRQATEVTGKLVRVMTVQPQEAPLVIEGFGTVRAKTEWSAVPEISGPVIRRSPYLRAGLHMRRGEVLFEIDPRPYELAARRIQAQITQYRKDIAVLQQQQRNHEASLRIAKRNLAIAQAELKRDDTLVKKGTISSRERNRQRQTRNDIEQAVQTAQNNLQLIGPRIATAEASIATARVQLAEAKLQLEKTTLVMPFDGQVLSSDVDLGEYVQAGREVAKLHDTTAVEIPISLTLDDLKWLPGLSPEALRTASDHAAAPFAQLPPATVQWRGETQVYTWQGHVGRWEAGLDARTRTLTLVVEVREPWKQFQPGEQPPLQPGMFCQVSIVARRVPNAVVIPRAALRPDQTVFVAINNALAIRPVRVLHVQKDRALLTAGLRAGEPLVVSPLTAPVVGMQLRLREVAPETLFSPLPSGSSAPAATVRTGGGSMSEGG